MLVTVANMLATLVMAMLASLVRHSLKTGFLIQLRTRISISMDRQMLTDITEAQALEVTLPSAI